MKLSGLLFLLAFSPSSYAQDANALETALQARFKDQIVTLKHFYVGSDVHLDPSGVPKHAREVGSWTLFSHLRVTNVNISDSYLKVEGYRAAAGFVKTEMKLFSTSDFFVVKIDFDGSPDSAAVHRALTAVLMTPSDHFEDYVPYYWKHYFRKDSQMDLIPGRIDDFPGPKLQKQQPFTRLRVSQGTQASKLIKQPKPQYPTFARSRGIQGSVVLTTVIGRNGKVIYLSIQNPAGLGLDEAAVDAVKDWEYRPAYINGEPVQIETQIIVNFNLSRSPGTAITLGIEPN